METLTGIARVSLVLFVLLAGCTKKSDIDSELVNGSKSAVKEFVELSTKAKDQNDKMRLESLCSGPMKQAFQAMSEDVFKMSYLDRAIQIQKIEFLKTDVNKEKASLQYRLVVENKEGVQPTVETIHREVELMQKENGEWQLVSIKPVGEDKIEFMRGMVF